MSDFKKRVSDALNKFSIADAKKWGPKTPRMKSNKKPEKETEKECLEWMRMKGWSVQILEAKATWSPSLNRWVNHSMAAGTCDCMGSTEDGIAVAIEFKAKGRLSSFNKDSNYRQRKFIVDKINANAFACVVDTSERLQAIYERWMYIRQQSKEQAKAFLISQLP